MTCSHNAPVGIFVRYCSFEQQQQNSFVFFSSVVYCACPFVFFHPVDSVAFVVLHAYMFLLSLSRVSLNISRYTRERVVSVWILRAMCGGPLFVCVFLTSGACLTETAALPWHTNPLFVCTKQL